MKRRPTELEAQQLAARCGARVVIVALDGLDVVAVSSGITLGDTEALRGWIRTMRRLGLKRVDVEQRKLLEPVPSSEDDAS